MRSFRFFQYAVLLVVSGCDTHKAEQKEVTVAPSEMLSINDSNINLFGNCSIEYRTIGYYDVVYYYDSCCDYNNICRKVEVVVADHHQINANFVDVFFGSSNSDEISKAKYTTKFLITPHESIDSIFYQEDAIKKVTLFRKMNLSWLEYRCKNGWQEIWANRDSSEYLYTKYSRSNKLKEILSNNEVIKQSEFLYKYKHSSSSH